MCIFNNALEIYINLFFLTENVSFIQYTSNSTRFLNKQRNILHVDHKKYLVGYVWSNHIIILVQYLLH